MLNAVWIIMLVAAVVCGALTGKLEAVTNASVKSAGAAVELAIGLVGVMAFWLGMMRILHKGGFLNTIARVLRPVMVRLFPGVPADHPAMSMMILNMTSNMLGLGNAATPFGLKAMMELNKLNRHQGVASDAMALFLAINTSNIALLPTGIIALRASLGSDAAGSILIPSLLATTFSTIVAIITAKLLAPRFAYRPLDMQAAADDDNGGLEIDTGEAEEAIALKQEGTVRDRFLALAALALLISALGYAFNDMVNEVGINEALKTVARVWFLLILICAIVLYGVFKGVKVYDAVVEGGKEGFQVALKIIPYLVAILVAVGMLRASGAIELTVRALEPITRLIGMPAEALPMALLRPLSGSGAYGVAADIMKTHGADSLIGNIVSTMQGSTETTFYVLALYFGVVAVRNARHTIAACLIADVAGALGAVWACLLILG